MIEEWLARRPPLGSTSPDNGNPIRNSRRRAEDDGYAKVVDVYCLHVLPRLGDWEYATEFMKYEQELPEARRLVRTLPRAIHARNFTHELLL